jgi:hypothetical protein
VQTTFRSTFLYLASDAAAFVTRANIAIDGGQRLRQFAEE